jgi:hypothetical protein
LGRFLNTSKKIKPNCVPVSGLDGNHPILMLITCKKIAKDVELTWDYGG